MYFQGYLEPSKGDKMEGSSPLSKSTTLLTGAQTGNTAAIGGEKDNRSSNERKKNPSLPTSKILQSMIANKPKAEVSPYVNSEASTNTTIKVDDLDVFMTKSDSMVIIHTQFDVSKHEIPFYFYISEY